MIAEKELISVVIPSYNECETILEAVFRILKSLGDSLLEVIVVDDDSPDRTWELVENLREPRCRLIRRIGRRGLASAIAEGTQAARGRIIVWLDCDLGIPPEDIMSLVEKLDSYDVAIGSRYIPGGKDTRPRFRAFLSYLFNCYARFLLGNQLRDWTSGFAAVRREVLQKAPLSMQGFGDYFIEWVYECYQRGLRVTEVPYHYGLRQAGQSKTDSNWLHFMKFGVSYTIRVLLIKMGWGKRS
jgi:dolichol-phosphate mannosyltransferase